MERGYPLRVASMQPKISPPLFHTNQTVASVGLDIKKSILFAGACWLYLYEDSREVTGNEEREREGEGRASCQT